MISIRIHTPDTDFNPEPSKRAVLATQPLQLVAKTFMGDVTSWGRVARPIPRRIALQQWFWIPGHNITV